MCIPMELPKCPGFRFLLSPILVYNPLARSQVCMSLVMARMASEAEKRKVYMLLPDSHRGGGGECGEHGQDHVEVQMSNKSAAIALPSTFFPRGSNWGNSSPPLVSHAGSMHSVADEGPLRTDEAEGTVTQTLLPMSQSNGAGMTNSSGGSGSSSSSRSGSCSKRGSSMSVQASPVAPGSSGTSSTSSIRVNSAGALSSPLSQAGSRRSGAIASSPLILAGSSKRSGTGSVVSSPMASGQGSRK